MASSESSMRLDISRLHWPVTALGYGRRVGIWFQGCSIRCPGCCSRDTWDADPRTETTVEALVDWMKCLPQVEALDGFTISGGEPFDQPQALFALLEALRREWGEQKDIQVYSGYPWGRLRSRHSAILAQIDLLITEPYLQEHKADTLRGSDNQRIHGMTPLGRQRRADITGSQAAIQMHFDGECLWLIGIPRPGDLDKLQQRLQERGLQRGQPSWLA